MSLYLEISPVAATARRGNEPDTSLPASGGRCRLQRLVAATRKEYQYNIVNLKSCADKFKNIKK